jgi:hypothetical protein
MPGANELGKVYGVPVPISPRTAVASFVLGQITSTDSADRPPVVDATRHLPWTWPVCLSFASLPLARSVPAGRLSAIAAEARGRMPQSKVPSPGGVVGSADAVLPLRVLPSPSPLEHAARPTAPSSAARSSAIRGRPVPATFTGTP